MTIHEWDQRPAETAKAFAAFALYRDQGPTRTQARVLRALGRPQGYMGVLEEWSSRHSWVARVRAWDAAQDQVRQRAFEDEVEKMARRQATNAQALQRVLLLPVEELMRRAAAGRVGLEKMTVKDLLVFAARSGAPMEAAVKIERLARGVSTENVHQSGDEPVEVRLWRPAEKPVEKKGVEEGVKDGG